MRRVRASRVLGGLLACGGLVGAGSYARADSSQRRRVTVGAEGVVRFLRSISVGLVISLDYWWAGFGLDEVSCQLAALSCCVILQWWM